MTIDGLTVCVNYSDLFARGIDRWAAGLDSLTVVTDNSDDRTCDLCARFPNVHVVRTDVFYESGAAFNKGAALSLAHKGMDTADWLLVFDADVIPQDDFRPRLESSSLTPGNLYGARRYQADENDPAPKLDLTRRMPQGWPIGFFLLFHASDPHVKVPLFDCGFGHAGNYDTLFTRQWPKSRQVILPNVPMIHLGEERQNWCGRYRQDELKAVLAKRRGGEDWQRERMKVLPNV